VVTARCLAVNPEHSTEINVLLKPSELSTLLYKLKTTIEHYIPDEGVRLVQLSIINLKNNIFKTTNHGVRHSSKSAK
jgi:hypothetical protein